MSRWGQPALRSLSRHRSFTMLVVLILALGIGATSAIFAVVDSLLRPLPFPDPERLVMLWEGHREEGMEKLHVSPPNLADWSRQSRSFEELAAIYPGELTLTGTEGAERVQGAAVSSNFLRALGIQPLAGRGFGPGEDSVAAPRVAMLSQDLWEQRYGAAPEVIGREVSVDGTLRTVIGIVPRGLELPRGAKVWLPLTLDESPQPRVKHFLQVLGRLKPGVTVAAAQSEMDFLTSRLARQYPESNAGWIVTVVPLLEELVGEARPTLRILAGAVGLVLFIACVNVAGLLLARSFARRPELAVRQALGASRLRIVAQLLGESFLMALLASLLGLALGWCLLRLALPLLPPGLSRARPIGLDSRALLFSLALGGLAALVSGLIPALRASAGNLADSLRLGGRWASQGGGLLLRNGLVLVELTLAFFLIANAILLTQSFLRLVFVDPGFRPAGVLSVGVDLDPRRYDSPQKVGAFFDALAERVSGLPGVEAVALTDVLPLTGSTEGTVFLPEGRPLPKPGEEMTTRLSIASRGFFQALGIPLLQGRDFGAGEVLGGPPVVIVNEALARASWPGENPVGKRMKLGFLDDATWYEVVGLAQDVRYEGLNAPVLPRVYVCHQQFPAPAMTLVLRSAGSMGGPAAGVRRELGALDKELPASKIQALDDLVAHSLAQRRLAMVAVGAFAAAALLLAVVGLYGLMATSVALRRKEFGIRLALGSRPGALLWMILRRALGLGGLAITAGWILTAVSGPALSGLLRDLDGGNLAALVLAGLILLAAVLMGSLLPARRATRVELFSVLQNE